LKSEFYLDRRAAGVVGVIGLVGGIGQAGQPTDVAFRPRTFSKANSIPKVFHLKKSN